MTKAKEPTDNPAAKKPTPKKPRAAKPKRATKTVKASAIMVLNPDDEIVDGTGLTRKQFAFCSAYLSNGFNGTKAAMAAGYGDAETTMNTLASIASENLRKPNIAAYIEKQMKKLAMSADEALARMSEMGRGDMRDYIRQSPDDLKEHPRGWLIKTYTQEIITLPGGATKEKIKIELYDAQKANELVLKMTGQLSENRNVNVSGNIKITKAEDLTDDELAKLIADEGDEEASSG